MDASPFNKLPAELKNMIWDLILPKGSAELGTAAATQPALLRVCRQIRNETLPMFYGNTDFHSFVYMNGARSNDNRCTLVPESSLEWILHWLNTLPSAAHGAARSLNVLILTKENWANFQSIDGQDIWEGFGKSLALRGYTGSRVKVTITALPPKAYTSPDPPHDWQIKYNVQKAKKLKDALRSWGMGMIETDHGTEIMRYLESPETQALLDT